MNITNAPILFSFLGKVVAVGKVQLSINPTFFSCFKLCVYMLVQTPDTVWHPVKKICILFIEILGMFLQMQLYELLKK